MKRGHKLALVVVLQLLILFGMVGFKYYTLNFGTPVLLKTAPVDPWDVFRGEYVRLGYEMSRINKAMIKEDLSGDSFGQRVYVVLEKKEKYWEAVAVHQKRPRLEENQVFIKAELQYYDEYAGTYFLTYGLESYYVEEGQGKELEQNAELDVQARVDRFGNAVLEEVVAR